MSPRRFDALRRLLPLSVLLATLWPAPARAATQEVTIGDTTYAPATITVHVSDTVTWRLTATVSGTSHTVTSDTGSPEGFDSGTLACSLICVTAPTFSHTFGKAGTYPYKCKIVPGMKGVVVVAPASSPSSTPTPSPTVPRSPTPSPTTPSPSASPTPTPSRSASPTPSRSASPTSSPSPTPTASATTSPTETAIAAAPTSAGGGPSGPVLVAIVSGLVALACAAGLIWLRRTGAW